ncbi:MAG: DUF5666 domain-containing protein [Terracidiphilus sp.]
MSSTILRPLLPSILMTAFFAVSALVFSQNMAAQPGSGRLLDGYITAVHAPDGFDVNGTSVTTSSSTEYGLIGGKAIASDDVKDALRVGAYVQVSGPKAAGAINAYQVLVRDNWDKRLEGLGLIDRVISAGSEPVFQADGYRVRITPATNVTYRGDLKTLADVGTGMWLRYAGKRDKTGDLVATQAAFIRVKPGKVKASSQPGTASVNNNAIPGKDMIIDANGMLLPSHSKQRMSDAGGWCGWHKVPGDQALQERVRRVGMSVVPAYQKQLAADDPSKIQFQFYAIDEPKIRSDVFCNEGLVLVPRQVVQRLKNDDQLAAVLADGVAFGLQRRLAKLIVQFREVLGAEIVGEMTGIFVPGVSLATHFGVGLATYAGTEAAENEIALKMERQRGRVSLALMADAGYDPWQAPDAWRLLASKHLPRNTNSLKYPDHSGYLLGILSLQYKQPADATSTALP